MSIIEILIRSFSGYIFVIPGILGYLLYLNKSGKKQTLLHNVFIFMFCYYLIGVLTMTGIGKLMSFEPQIVFIPFLDMVCSPIYTILNVVLFVPLGIFLPLLWKKWDHIGTVALTGFLFSLSIELVQMFDKGITDINDLIANTVGAYIGYWIYKLLLKLLSKHVSGKCQSIGRNDITEVLFLTLYCFIVMVTIQPLIISGLFGLG